MYQSTQETLTEDEQNDEDTIHSWTDLPIDDQGGEGPRMEEPESGPVVLFVDPQEICVGQTSRIITEKSEKYLVCRQTLTEAEQPSTGR
jgi:hypothetical protein